MCPRKVVVWYNKWVRFASPSLLPASVASTYARTCHIDFELERNFRRVYVCEAPMARVLT